MLPQRKGQKTAAAPLSKIAWKRLFWPTLLYRLSIMEGKGPRPAEGGENHYPTFSYFAFVPREFQRKDRSLRLPWVVGPAPKSITEVLRPNLLPCLLLLRPLMKHLPKCPHAAETSRFQPWAPLVYASNTGFGTLSFRANVLTELMLTFHYLSRTGII